MKIFKKVWDKIRQPNLLWLTLFYVFFAILLAGTIVLVCLEKEQSVCHFLLYILSAVSLAYCVYTIFYIAPKITERIIANLQKHKFANTLLSNYGYRTLIFGLISLSLNIAYVVFMGILAIMTGSVWYMAITIYYLVLILIKGTVFYFKFAERKHRKSMIKLKNCQDNIEGEVELKDRSKSFDPQIKQAKTYRYCGIMFILLTIAMSGIIVLMYTSNMYFEYAGLMIYAVATFTFYRLTVSIINLIKASKQDDLYVQSIRNINLASALVSIIVLQVSLFQAFSPQSNTSIANGLTGGAVSIVILALGIFMIVKANKIIKNRRKNNE